MVSASAARFRSVAESGQTRLRDDQGPSSRRGSATRWERQRRCPRSRDAEEHPPLVADSDLNAPVLEAHSLASSRVLGLAVFSLSPNERVAPPDGEPSATRPGRSRELGVGGVSEAAAEGEPAESRTDERLDRCATRPSRDQAGGGCLLLGFASVDYVVDP